MSVVSVKEGWGGQAWHDREGKGAVRIFSVETDDWDSEVIAREAEGIPQKGKPHPDDPNLKVERNRAKRQKSGHLFKVTVEYRTGDARLGGSDAIHPLKRPPEVAWGETSIMMPVDFAVDGVNTRKTIRILKGAGVGVQETEIVYRGGIRYKIRRVKCPVVNTAGSVPNPKPMVETAVPVMTITRNVKDYDAKTLLPYWNTLNKSTFRGFPKGTVMLRSIIGDPREEEVDGKSYEYYGLVHNLLIRPDGWAWRMKNEGMVRSDPLFDEGLVITDNKSGVPFGEPRLLDKKGAVANFGAAPIWLYYDFKEEQSWIKLKIG